MTEEAFQIENLPDLKDPLFIAGFDGWGNALNLSRGMVDYLIRKLNGTRIGKINADLFYRYDENRPVVDIQDGLLKDFSPPGGAIFTTQQSHVGRDLIILRATEPNLRWFQFVDAILSLCQKAGVKRIISLGSMYDNVLHTDSLISGLASSKKILAELEEKKVFTVNYKGPGAIHSAIHAKAKERGVECMSLWCHCPYYLQGTTHLGLLSHLGSLLADLGGFDLDTEELEVTWKDLSKQIQKAVDENPELQGIINDLRKAKVRGSWDAAKRHDKIIHLEDFQRPK